MSATPLLQRTLRTESLLLRSLTEDDCTQTYLDWLDDLEIKRFLETRHTAQSVEAIRTFVAAVNASPVEFLYGICVHADSDRHIGNIKVGPIKHPHPLADVSLLIGARDCWGKGYGTEAIQAVSREAFARWGVRKLSASIYAPNIGSTKAFLAAGYQQEGLRRSHYLLEGTMTDLVELGAVEEDVV